MEAQTKENQSTDVSDKKEKFKRFETKVSFVAGIALIFSVIGDALELIDFSCVYTYICMACLAIVLLILLWVSKTDRVFSSKMAHRYGTWYTFVSIILLFARNTLLACLGDSKIDLVHSDNPRTLVLVITLSVVVLVYLIIPLIIFHEKKEDGEQQ